MQKILARPIALFLLLPLVACGSGGDNPTHLVTRDSSGVSIMTYPAAAWDSTPVWQLSERPATVIGGDSADASMDLSATIAATLFPDGRSAVSTNNPAELMLFDANGIRQARLGAPGDGPGEYHMISTLMVTGGDTLLAFDATRRKVLYFAGNGAPLGEQFVPGGTSGVSPLMRGRLTNGAFLFTEEALGQPSVTATPKPFRNRMLVLSAVGDSPNFDTLGTSLGVELIPATVMAGGQVTPIAKPVIFGAVTQVVTGGRQWYLSRADRLEIETHDPTGKLVRIVRLNLPERLTTPADQEKYKATVREAYERVRSMVPADIFAQELKKLDETAFADHLPAVGQLITDQEGNLWVNRGFSLLDKVRSWLIFNPEGHPIGRAETPIGSVLAIAGDRLILRREDVASRKVGVEVYSLKK